MYQLLSSWHPRGSTLFLYNKRFTPKNIRNIEALAICVLFIQIPLPGVNKQFFSKCVFESVAVAQLILMMFCQDNRPNNKDDDIEIFPESRQHHSFVLGNRFF